MTRCVTAVELDNICKQFFLAGIQVIMDDINMHNFLCEGSLLTDIAVCHSPAFCVPA